MTRKRKGVGWSMKSDRELIQLAKSQTSMNSQMSSNDPRPLFSRERPA